MIAFSEAMSAVVTRFLAAFWDTCTDRLARCSRAISPPLWAASIATASASLGDGIVKDVIDISTLWVSEATSKLFDVPRARSAVVVLSTMSGSPSLGKSLTAPVQEVARAWIGRECMVNAPSKLNLRLKVEGRRVDRYHLLSMLNCSTSLQDTLRIVLTEERDIKVTVKPEGVLPLEGQENLAARAFKSFWREFGFEDAPLGLRCEIKKNIPVGGGLGGGSADAGAVLRHLEGIFSESLSVMVGASRAEVQQRVLRAALSCGADVPYAVVGGLCWVGGIGEEVVPIRARTISPTKALIVIPPKPVPTIAFYDRYRREWPALPAISDDLGRRFISSGEELLPLVANDFEETACGMVPEIAEALSLMREVFPAGTALTGSGSVCFSLVPDGMEEVAVALSKRLTSQGFTSTVCFLIFS